MKYIITFDVGTTYIKGVLYAITEYGLQILKLEKEKITLYVKDEFVEQDANEWWEVTKKIIKKLANTEEIKNNIVSIGFCCQMLCLVSLDENLRPIRRTINYMDNRVKKTKIFGHIFTLIYSILRYKVGSISAKDILQKLQWLQKNETDNYNKTYKFMDASDYFTSKLTSKFSMSSDNAFVSFMYNPDKNQWDKKILNSYNVDINKLCNIKKVYESKGNISEEIAHELGLPNNISIFGGGDLTCISYSAYNKDSISTNIYWGTSGWVSTIQNKKKIDIKSSSTSLLSAIKGKYNFMGQLETTGKSLEYMLSLLQEDYSFIEGIYNDTKVGAGGLMFSPWINGERTPFNNANARSSFIGINLQTSKKDMIRAVIEGICLEYYWELKIINKYVEIGDSIYFIGGGANSDDICQILSDVINKNVIVEENCQYAGNYGIAKIICDNLNIHLNNTVHNKIFQPNKENHECYEKMLKKFKKLKDISK